MSQANSPAYAVRSWTKYFCLNHCIAFLLSQVTFYCFLLKRLIKALYIFMIKKHYSIYFLVTSFLCVMGVSVFAAALPLETPELKTEKDLAVILLVVFVFLALVISFLCSVAEAVLLSITPAYIENQKSKNSKLANQLKKLREDNIDRSLAAILTMNTIAHTVGAIEAGAQASIVFGSNWVGLFSAVITLLILVFSEIIPKTLGAVYWSKLVGFTQLYIRGLIIMLYPLVLISELITKLIAGGKKYPRHLVVMS